MHPGVDVEFQGFAWVESDYCNRCVDKTFKAAVTGGSGVKPAEQSIVFADNLRGQTTEEFKKELKEGCNTLLKLLAPGWTNEVQSVDAGYGRLVKLGVGKALEAWYEEGDNVEKWGTNKLSSSDSRVLLTHWVGEAVAKLDSDQLYRRHLFDKTGLMMTADGTDDNLINLEGLDGPYTFMNADDSREPRDDVQPFSPAAKSIPTGRVTRMTMTKRRVITPAELVDRTT